MNNKNGKIIVQAVLVTTFFLAILGVYVFNVTQMNILRADLNERLDDVDRDLDTIKLAVSNHLSISELRLKNIEEDVDEIKEILKE